MYLLISKFLIRFLPVIYMLLIWMQTSHFDPESVQVLSNYISMKLILLIGIGLELGHLFEFGLLYLLIIVAILTFRKLDSRKEFIALTISLIYGLIDEIHQYYIPFRSASFVDLTKNTIGVFVFWFFIHKSYFVNGNSKLGFFLKKITNLFKKGKISVMM